MFTAEETCPFCRPMRSPTSSGGHKQFVGVFRLNESGVGLAPVAVLADFQARASAQNQSVYSLNIGRYRPGTMLITAPVCAGLASPALKRGITAHARYAASSSDSRFSDGAVVR